MSKVGMVPMGMTNVPYVEVETRERLIRILPGPHTDMKGELRFSWNGAKQLRDVLDEALKRPGTVRNSDDAWS